MNYLNTKYHLPGPNMQAKIMDSILYQLDSMGLEELLLLSLSLSKISQQEQDLDPCSAQADHTFVTCPVDEYLDFLAHILNSTAKERLSQLLVHACRSLMSRLVELDGLRSWQAWKWTDDVKLAADQVVIHFNKKMPPYLIWLKLAADKALAKLIADFVDLNQLDSD